MPRLARITIYPIKSFDGTTVESAVFTPGGGLLNDRRFAFRAAGGELINGKKYPVMHRLRSEFAADASTATFRFPDGARETFRLAPGNDDLNRRMSAYFGTPVHLEENVDEGFMDDPDSMGPTIVAIASLESIVA